jgi:hypothetical protein
MIGQKLSRVPENAHLVVPVVPLVPENLSLF